MQASRILLEITFEIRFHAKTEIVLLRFSKYWEERIRQDTAIQHVSRFSHRKLTILRSAIYNSGIIISIVFHFILQFREII